MIRLEDIIIGIIHVLTAKHYNQIHFTGKSIYSLSIYAGFLTDVVSALIMNI